MPLAQVVLAQNILRTLQKQAGVLEYSLKKLEVLQSGYWSQSTAKELVFKAGKRPFEVPVYESKVLVSAARCLVGSLLHGAVFPGPCRCPTL